MWRITPSVLLRLVFAVPEATFAASLIKVRLQNFCKGGKLCNFASIYIWTVLPFIIIVFSRCSMWLHMISLQNNHSGLGLDRWIEQQKSFSSLPCPFNPLINNAHQYIPICTWYDDNFHTSPISGTTQENKNTILVFTLYCKNQFFITNGRNTNSIYSSDCSSGSCLFSYIWYDDQLQLVKTIGTYSKQLQKPPILIMAVYGS